MDFTTNYLGLRLANPLMPGASPLADELGTVRRLEDCGAAAIVLRSLFEEQITRDQLAAHRYLENTSSVSAESLSFFPSSESFVLTPDSYLEQVRRVREAVKVPVIASLNGTTSGGWVEYAKLCQDAGAHALELNLYTIPTDPADLAGVVEARAVAVVKAVTASVTIPVAVKLSPFYSSLPNFAKQLSEAGAMGVVLFNRFYQPDIDPAALDVKRTLTLSDSSELLLRVHWLAILSGRTKLSLAASGGVHSSLDAIKALMAGAQAVQLVSALLRHGPTFLKTVLNGVSAWLTKLEYESVGQLIGSMSLAKSPSPAAYERGNYATLLQSYHGA